MANFKDSVAPWIGLVAMAAFGWFVYYLIHNLGAGEPQWSRAVYIFGGVEAVAFAAAGFFFGKEVHRERAETAESEAKTANQAKENAVAEKKDVERRLTDVIKIIEEKKNKKSKATLADLLARHKQLAPEIAVKFPGFADYAVSQSGVAVGADPDWEDLVMLSKNIAER
jgi:hypothetical protein